MEMTRERLESYRSNKEEIKELQYKLNHLGEGDSMIGNDVILDGTKGYLRPQSVVGYDYKKHDRLCNRYMERITQLQKECEEVEMWIERIEDGLTRRIFRMYFLDGKSQQAIARKIHIHQTAVSKKISAYLQME